MLLYVLIPAEPLELAKVCSPLVDTRQHLLNNNWSSELALLFHPARASRLKWCHGYSKWPNKETDTWKWNLFWSVFCSNERTSDVCVVFIYVLYALCVSVWTLYVGACEHCVWAALVSWGKRKEEAVPPSEAAWRPRRKEQKEKKRSKQATQPHNSGFEPKTKPKQRCYSVSCGFGGWTAELRWYFGSQVWRVKNPVLKNELHVDKS